MTARSIISSLFSLLFLIQPSVAFDCPHMEIHQFFSRAEVIVDGEVIEVHDSTYEFSVDRYMRGQGTHGDTIEIYKQRERSDAFGPPNRFRPYSKGEKLLLFLNVWKEAGILAQRGCYFEGELWRIGDFASYSRHRWDDYVMCSTCRIFSVDSIAQVVADWDVIKNVDPDSCWKNRKIDDLRTDDISNLRHLVQEELCQVAISRRHSEKADASRSIRAGWPLYLIIAATLVVTSVIAK